MEGSQTQSRGPPPPLKPKPGSVQVARSLYQYKAKKKEELSVGEGDLLYILDKSQPDYWKVRSGNKVGLIPKDCVENHEIREPLHDAARRGNISFLQECLKQGVSSAGLDAIGNSPLYWAAASGHKDCVECLLKQPHPPLNFQNHIGDTPLHGAALKSHFKIVKLLLKKGADCNIPNNNGELPEHLAQDLSVKNLLHKNRPNRNSSGVVTTFSPEDYEDDEDNDDDCDNGNEN